MMQKKVFDLLVDQGITIAFAESMTGGALSYEMVKYPNASKVVKGSIVAYSEQMKIDLLNVNRKTIDQFSIVSKEVAYEMAKGILDKTHANICISITGNAGPQLEKNTNSKVAYYVILINEKAHQFKIELTEDTREKNIFFAINHIYQKLYELI